MWKRLFRLRKSHSGGSFAAPEDRRGALGGEAVILEVFRGTERRQRWDSKICVFHCILQGSVQMTEKANRDKKQGNVENVVCFTVLDAIS